MESLNNDDYYKFGMFEEEKDYNDMFADEFNENDCDDEEDDEEEDDEEEDEEEEDDNEDEEDDNKNNVTIV